MKKIKATKRRQKNFFLTLLLILIFWSITGGMIGFVEPDLVKDLIIPNSYLVFFGPLFLSFFLTLSVIFANSRRGLLMALGIIIFLVLRLHELGNLLNLFLIFGLITAVDYYFTQKH
ncbi:hypothetical protein A2160_03855 [Candidatus Beckwithbacteria bacterium RBG_13_42_9]|uniref:Uncharacterized protein n=1 Tax=Candidatus Beckwithbacteria bacterium RBG_13_42_9 TaxID=1797457 RepID=A0A1F5E506_9BACT|nr:MAG: hypothetical protein A2160_03855 [Candidatus Beckwithbacteria bacterium RBG_13_42_9]